MFFAVYLDDGGVRGLDRPSRFILVLPVMVLLLCVSNRKEWLWYAVAFGSTLAFFVALYERIVLGVDRANGQINAIMFGNIAMLLGFLSFSGAVYFYSQRRFVLLAVMLCGGVCGVGASVLSGTRGGWIGLPLIGLFMFWQCRDLMDRKALFSVCTLVTIFLVSVVAIPETGVQKRVAAAVDDIENYIDGSNAETSVGARFDMWKSALYMFQQAPLLGVGQSQTIPIKKQLASEGKISDYSVGFSHAHNEYLDALSKRGIIGLAFLMLLYLLPLRLFLRKLKQCGSNWRIRSYAIAGALIPMCYMDFALTQVMFGHNIGVTMYAFLIVYFWAAVRWAEREELSQP
ncbi:O-antigen ligase family protein [Marinomonas sp. C2222]|uniref:O-antigen ligase family protein n=1 Tax=Marinomonas sargassi TaxID=2984494 RepID=A0ABT2YPK0_9GAMM|nr:O-antigen ligase family protein [Marinomonas sargassi]MCV2401624.1 O-antigen ligase family protein [Marinomonas sargassi]